MLGRNLESHYSEFNKFQSFWKRASPWFDSRQKYRHLKASNVTCPNIPESKKRKWSSSYRATKWKLHALGGWKNSHLLSHYCYVSHQEYKKTIIQASPGCCWPNISVSEWQMYQSNWGSPLPLQCTEVVVHRHRRMLHTILPTTAVERNFTSSHKVWKLNIRMSSFPYV